MKEAALKSIIKHVLTEMKAPNHQELFHLFKVIDPNSSLYDAPFKDAPRNFAWVIMVKYQKKPEDAVYAIEQFWRQSNEVAKKMVDDVLKLIYSQNEPVDEDHGLGFSHNVSLPQDQNTMNKPTITPLNELSDKYTVTLDKDTTVALSNTVGSIIQVAQTMAKNLGLLDGRYKEETTKYLKQMNDYRKQASDMLVKHASEPVKEEIKDKDLEKAEAIANTVWDDVYHVRLYQDVRGIKVFEVDLHDDAGPKHLIRKDKDGKWYRYKSDEMTAKWVPVDDVSEPIAKRAQAGLNRVKSTTWNPSSIPSLKMK